MPRDAAGHSGCPRDATGGDVAARTAVPRGHATGAVSRREPDIAGKSHLSEAHGAGSTKILDRIVRDRADPTLPKRPSYAGDRLIVDGVRAVFRSGLRRRPERPGHHGISSCRNRVLVRPCHDVDARFSAEACRILPPAIRQAIESELGGHDATDIRSFSRGGRAAESTADTALRSIAESARAATSGSARRRSHNAAAVEDHLRAPSASLDPDVARRESAAARPTAIVHSPVVEPSIRQSVSSGCSWTKAEHVQRHAPDRW